MLKEKVLQELRKVMDPELNQNVVDLQFIREVEIIADKAIIHFQPDVPACPLINEMVSKMKEVLGAVEGIREVEVVVEKKAEPAASTEQRSDFGGIDHLNQVSKVIAVMSGKGGVGKSLVAGLLAAYLNRSGLSVGILDADITGPSIPKLFFKEQPKVTYSPRSFLPPVTTGGIRVMSINLLLNRPDEAVIWRGPLVGKAIKQFWTDTLWGKMDFLIVDLPPGTSDAPLTVMQSLPMSGIILVTSPQELAGMVVRKAANMAGLVGIPILGIIENMSYFIAPDTGKKYEIFGPSHVESIAQAFNLPLLARLPIDSQIAIQCDQGNLEQARMAEFEQVAAWVQQNTPDCHPPKMVSANKPTP